jgi:hypothetical protein
MIKNRRTRTDEKTGDTLTYEIDTLEGFKIFKESEEFRNFTRKGNFIHCENRFVINHPMYVKHKKGGGVELTDYAKANEKECCVVFTLVKGE